MKPYRVPSYPEAPEPKLPSKWAAIKRVGMLAVIVAPVPFLGVAYAYYGRDAILFGVDFGVIAAIVFTTTVVDRPIWRSLSRAEAAMLLAWAPVTLLAIVVVGFFDCAKRVGHWVRHGDDP
jgi:hypothetical protein